MTNSEYTLDLRKIRTRKTIINAFQTILQQKEFNDIRISEIAEEAMINRVTFYNHFIDKYELLEIVVKNSIHKRLIKEVGDYNALDKELLTRISFALLHFHKEHQHMCDRSYTETIANVDHILRSEVQEVIKKALKKSSQNIQSDTSQLVASTLSWMLYGLSLDMRKEKESDLCEYYDDIFQVLNRMLTK